MHSELLTLESGPGGAAVLRIHPPGKVNVLTSALLIEAERLLGAIEGEDSITACIITGAGDDFLAGADLREILSAQSESELVGLAGRAQALFTRIERSPKTFVAAIHGPALGGGLELALACHARVATDDSRTVLALPEVTLGLIPGAGGTQRLARLVGLRAAVPMLVGGQRIRPSRALSIGLVDAIAPPDLLLQTSFDLARRLPEPPRLRLVDRLLARRPFRRMFLDRVRHGVLLKTRGHYPAPLAALECLETGYSRGLEAGLEAELRHFSMLAVSPGSRNLIRIFLNSTEAKKLPSTPSPRRIERLGVLGAGLMGEGITAVSLSLAAVTLKDVSPQALDRASAAIGKSIARRVDSGSLSTAAATRQRASLRTTTSADDLRDCDLVIEAVFEELELKRRVLAETEAVISPVAVYASNTSAIPISSIAAGARQPERVLGMHYFSPVPRMPLLELVVTPTTADWAVRTAQAFGAAQGKSVIVVRDSPGFYTTRILAPYLNEAVMLLEEGAGMKEIDETAEAFGFPVGPLSLINHVGIAVAAHVSRDLAGAFEERGHRRSPLLERLAEESGRFEERAFRNRAPFDARNAVDRLVLAMVNEAARCLDEGIVGSEADADLGAVLGLGFPPFRGGPFRFVHDSGVEEIRHRLQQLADQHGARFTPTPYFAGTE